MEGLTEMSYELKSTNVVQQFTRIQDQFRDIRGQEVAMTVPFHCLEQQLASFVKKEVIYSDDQILQALAAVGLHAYDRATGGPTRSWDQLPDAVRQLATNLTMSFDPAFNPELKEVADKVWTSGDEQEIHFREWGSVVRRLMGSVRFRQKRDPRGYCRFVVSFVAQHTGDDDDKPHWALLTKTDEPDQLPPGLHQPLQGSE